MAGLADPKKVIKPLLPDRFIRNVVRVVMRSATAPLARSMRALTNGLFE